jgi:hypothetical protein
MPEMKLFSNVAVVITLLPAVSTSIFLTNNSVAGAAGASSSSSWGAEGGSWSPLDIKFVDSQEDDRPLLPPREDDEHIHKLQ